MHFVGADWSLPAYLWFCSVTAVLSFIDLRIRLIPDRILFPGTAVGLALLAGGAALEARLHDLPEALASGLGYFLVLLVMNFLTRGAIGMGDVKLAFLLGLFAGYNRWETAAAAGVGAFLLAGAASALLLALRLRTHRDHIPFGPFMTTAAWTAIAWSLSSAPPLLTPGLSMPTGASCPAGSLLMAESGLTTVPAPPDSVPLPDRFRLRARQSGNPPLYALPDCFVENAKYSRNIPLDDCLKMVYN